MELPFSPAKAKPLLAGGPESLNRAYTLNILATNLFMALINPGVPALLARPNTSPAWIRFLAFNTTVSSAILTGGLTAARRRFRTSARWQLSDADHVGDEATSRLSAVYATPRKPICGTYKVCF
jgi:hypothetical protein